MLAALITRMIFYTDFGTSSRCFEEYLPVLELIYVVEFYDSFLFFFSGFNLFPN